MFLGLLIAFAAPELTWRAPPGCPGEQDVREALARMLPAETDASADRYRTTLEVVERGGRWEATVFLDDGTSKTERTITAKTCATATSTAVLLVAMAIDPRLALGVPPALDLEPGEPAPTVPPPAVAATPPRRTDRAPPATPEPTPRTSARARAVFALQAGLGLAPMPALQGTVSPSVGVAVGRVTALLGGDWWLPRNRDSPQAPDIGARATAWSIGPRLCAAAYRGRRVEVPICASAQIGLVHAHGTGTLQSLRRRALWGRAGAGAGVWVWLSRSLGLALDAEALVPWTRPAFRTEPSGTVFRTPAAGVRGVLGIVVRWP
jgi:hypothetical protein